MILRGYLLLVFGIVAGIFVASLDVATVNWRLFVPAVVLATVGTQQIRQGRRSAARDRHRLEADRRTLEGCLDTIVEHLRQLQEAGSRLSPFEVRHEIDRRLREHLERFADARATLAHLYGLQAYADIIGEFAAGERYVNRVWSASADGYIDEVSTYLDRARVQFEHARRRLQAVQAH